MVGLGRVELPTSPLSGVRSNQLSYRPKFGGAGRDRTGDLLNANQALSQLSYSPGTKPLPERTGEASAPRPLCAETLSRPIGCGPRDQLATHKRTSFELEKEKLKLPSEPEGPIDIMDWNG